MNSPVPRRSRTALAGFVLALSLALAAAAPLRADGFIIPDRRSGEPAPPLSVKFHRVKVEIDGQVARTSVDQVFLNPTGRDIEGTYIFPVPEGASVSGFAMFVGDRRIEGEVLSGAEARRTYEDIVRRMKDPGLLEYLGRGLFRARVYPIPARGEKRVQISYTEVLKAEGGLVRYLYPLATERFSSAPLEDLGVTVLVSSPVPVVNVYSPSHRVSVRREGPGKAVAGFEARGVRPDKDFLLYYSLSPDDVGLSFLGGEGPDGGHFLFLASPRFAAAGERVVAKDVVLVLDSSGSMSGAKMRQAKEAARFILGHLGRGDAFTLVDFDDAVTPFTDALVPATPENVGRALDFVEAIEDTGGTNINDALLAALARTRGGDRPGYVLFLTDGLPTSGTTDTADILANAAKADVHRSRIFVFGVGHDVNTQLLDRVATGHRGTSVYVGEDEDLERALSGFYEKVASPVLTDLSVEFRGVEVSRVYPKVLPDLFKGSQLVLVGRYTGRGPVTAVLTGRAGGQVRRFVLEGVRTGSGGRSSFLPRLWATRRVGDLLEEVRLRGSDPELVAEIERLGLKYGIVTPYTSFLVTEREAERLDAAAPAAREAVLGGVVGGVGAVRAAKATLAFKNEDRPAQTVSERILYKEDKTFYLKDGVWTDSEYAEGARLTEIAFDSDEFYRLLTAKPGLAKYLSVGRNVVVVFEGVTYKIVE